MKTLLRLAVSTVVVAANVYAVEMADFELDLEYRNIKQLEKIANANIKVAFGVDAFTEHYRAHMWNIRNNCEHTPEENEIVRYESLKYYNTVYKLIPTEIARCIFGIKGGMVEYTDDNDEILECKGGKPIEQYDQSNWNYVVFVNVLNAKMNGDGNGNKNETIDEIGGRIIKHFDTKYTSLIKWAVNDIKEYFAALELEKYILEMQVLRKNIRKAEDEGEKFSNTKEGGCYSELDLIWHETVKSLGTVKMEPTKVKLGSLEKYLYTYDLSIAYNVLPNDKDKKRYEVQYYLGNVTENLETYAPLTINQEAGSAIKVDELIKQVLDEADYDMLHGIVSKLSERKLSFRNGLNKIRKKAEEGKTITSEDKFANIVYDIIQLMDGSTVSGLPDMAPDSTDKEALEKMKDFIKEQVAKLKQAMEAEIQRQEMEEEAKRQHTKDELEKTRKRLEIKLGELEKKTEEEIQGNKKEEEKQTAREIKKVESKIIGIGASIQRLGNNFFKGDKIATYKNIINKSIDYILLSNIISDEDIEAIEKDTTPVSDDEFVGFANEVKELTKEEMAELEQQKQEKEEDDMEKKLLAIIEELESEPKYLRAYKAAIDIYEKEHPAQ